MKKHMVKFFITLMLSACSLSIFAKAQLEDIKGSWLGTMDIPQGPSLRIGVEIFKKADGNWGGNIASIDQNDRYMLVSSVEVLNGIFTLQLAGAPISVVGNISDDNQIITAKLNQGESVFELILNKVNELPEIVRQQTPKGLVTYIQKDVTYQNSHDKTWLSGTLTMPNDSKKHPAIMLISGSGPSHRDSFYAGHRTFKVLADHLTKLGYVVLRSDKRGVYKSSGNFEEATLNNLALDTKAAVKYLKSNEYVDPENIILIGHSEGSLVAVMASELEQVQGIVSLAGPGMSVLDVLLMQDKTEPAAKGATEEETNILVKFSQRFYQMIMSTPSSVSRKQKANELYQNLTGLEAEVVGKWVNKNNGTLSISAAESNSLYELLQQNPLPYWHNYQGKALILNGDKDSQVPAKENLTGIVNAITNKNSSVQSEIFVGLNHLFQPANTGAVDEYSNIEITIDEKVLNVISNWLDSNFK